MKGGLTIDFVLKPLAICFILLWNSGVISNLVFAGDLNFSKNEVTNYRDNALTIDDMNVIVERISRMESLALGHQVSLENYQRDVREELKMLRNATLLLLTVGSGFGDCEERIATKNEIKILYDALLDFDKHLKKRYQQEIDFYKAQLAAREDSKTPATYFSDSSTAKTIYIGEEKYEDIHEERQEEKNDQNKYNEENFTKFEDEKLIINISLINVTEIYSSTLNGFVDNITTQIPISEATEMPLSNFSNFQTRNSLLESDDLVLEHMLNITERSENVTSTISVEETDINATSSFNNRSLLTTTINPTMNKTTQSPEISTSILRQTTTTSLPPKITTAGTIMTTPVTEHFTTTKKTTKFLARNHSKSIVCPKGSAVVGTECFSVHLNEQRNWTASRAFCRNRGGDLAEPNIFNDKLPKQLARKWPQLRESGYWTLWVGATDQEIENEWHWVTGGLLDLKQSSMWDLREPPTLGDAEDCLAMVLWASGRHQRWDLVDDRCDLEWSVFCEYTKIG